MDPLEKARRGMGKLESAISGLPGVQGYREKDMRRDADKQVREQLSKRLSDIRRRVTELQGRMLRSGGLQFMSTGEQLSSRLQTLADRIRTASYGYAGFFDLQKVQEAQLDRLAAFDQALFERVAALEAEVDALDKAVAANQGVAEAIQAASTMVGQISDEFGHRSEAMQADA